mmetsp:Transcript_2522/g.4024  ORF Transcript_2522/g.4024 Transcript_2522/m.4024 type:complete len:154 (+) Transcript_2522:545-1006(+)
MIDLTVELNGSTENSSTTTLGLLFWVPIPRNRAGFETTPHHDSIPTRCSVDRLANVAGSLAHHAASKRKTKTRRRDFSSEQQQYQPKEQTTNKLQAKLAERAIIGGAGLTRLRHVFAPRAYYLYSRLVVARQRSSMTKGTPLVVLHGARLPLE